MFDVVHRSFVLFLPMMLLLHTIIQQQKPPLSPRPLRWLIFDFDIITARCSPLKLNAPFFVPPFLTRTQTAASLSIAQLIAEGSGEDEEADVELRRDAVDNYLDLLETPAVPDQVK